MSGTISKPKRKPAAPDPSSPYVRGDGAAGRYLGFRDAQGRTFREWAKGRNLPYAMIGGSPVYRKADLDKAWRASVPKIFPQPNQ